MSLVVFCFVESRAHRQVTTMMLCHQEIFNEPTSGDVCGNVLSGNNELNTASNEEDRAWVRDINSTRFFINLLVDLGCT